MEYHEYIRSKSQLKGDFGFDPTYMPDFLFDFQKFLVERATVKGRSAMFADCGMGKTLMQLTWAQNVVEHTNKPVLILSPLSVSSQTVEESKLFGIDASRSMDGSITKKIVVTNYEKLDKFDWKDFSGVVCDESSILKNFDGVRKAEITNFMRKIKYRLLCTATAAPNDYIELGTSSEALGQMGYVDMLTAFFKNDEDTVNPINIGSKWRFKKHSEQDFWRWMASWAMACRRPSDLGFDDGQFILPNKNENQHILPSPVLPGEMFSKPIVTLSDLREESRLTVNDRCEKAADLLVAKGHGIAWVHTNREADVICSLVNGAVNVQGSDKDDVKEEKFNAFRHGEITTLVTKPKIAAFGMNWQHNNYMTYFPTYSYEQYYQSIRRCWRFGQKKNVTVEMITTESQKNVMRIMMAKAEACDVMFNSLIYHMNNSLTIDNTTKFNQKSEMPTWI